MVLTDKVTSKKPQKLRGIMWISLIAGLIRSHLHTYRRVILAFKLKMEIVEGLEVAIVQPYLVLFWVLTR